MILESYLNEILERLLSSELDSPIAAEQLISCIDLTLLDEQAPKSSLSQLSHDAQSNKVAAICVNNHYLTEFKQLQGIQLATVTNFPYGNEEISTTLQAIDKAVQLGATEIDYVFPYPAYFDGKRDKAFNQSQTVVEACKKHHLTLKIILETGAFADLQDIYEISKILAALGCNFLKTSTGKIPQGATLPTVFTIISAIKDTRKNCGIKISGGIKTASQATNYAKLAMLMMGKEIDKTWFRIGASSLLGELLKINQIDSNTLSNSLK